MRIASLLICLLLPLTAQDWSGEWRTNWRGGSARLILEQKGKTVTGSYPVYDGHVKGEIREGLLVGTWTEPKQSGGFVFALSKDGETFSGRYDSGEYWNGHRLTPNSGSLGTKPFLEAKLNSPRDTLRSFLLAFKFIENGDSDYLSTALSCCLFPQELLNRPLDERITLATAYYQLLNETTFRLWQLPGADGRTLSVRQKRWTTDLHQLGTRNTVTLQLRKEAKEWKIVLPELSFSNRHLERLKTSRGVSAERNSASRGLGNPRETLKTFLQGKNHKEMFRALDLSEIEPGVRDQEARIFCEYLHAIFDRAGLIIWQEIPNDGDALSPFTYFEHPKGNVTLSPRRSDQGETIWLFTPETLDSLPELYRSVEPLPIVDGKQEQRARPIFFRMRSTIGKFSPALQKRLVLLENWQWLGLVFLGLISFLGARLATKLSSKFLHWRTDEAHLKLKAKLEQRFLKPLFLTFVAGIWHVGVPELGLPDKIFTALELTARALLVIGFSWALFMFIDLLGGSLLQKAKRTDSQLDDIFVSLLSSLLKLLTIIGGFIVLAEVLHIPYRTVLAGLGIGGLAIAIAARDTLANFFGSAVLLTDRPFRRGDLVEVAETTGYISKVGLRSTHIRTLEDAVLIIPNNVLVNEKITNLKPRRRRFVRSIISVTYDTSPELLNLFRERLLELIAAQPGSDQLEKHAGIWEFAASSIDLEIFCYVSASNRSEEYTLRHGLFVGIIELAEEIGVEFAFPTRTLHIESGPGEPTT